jgi:hypothetical protein
MALNWKTRSNVHVQLDFDRNVIHTNWNRINRSPLQYAGVLVMREARQSIRRRKNRELASIPGTPPYSHVEGRIPPFKQIYSVPNWANSQVTVGMIGYGGTPAVPGLHEHGGTAIRSVRTRTYLAGRGSAHPRRRNGTFRRQYYRDTYAMRMVTYPRRPFMLPALMRIRHRLPMLWLNSLGRAA